MACHCRSCWTSPALTIAADWASGITCGANRRRLLLLTATRERLCVVTVAGRGAWLRRTVAFQTGYAGSIPVARSAPLSCGKVGRARS